MTAPSDVHFNHRHETFLRERCLEGLQAKTNEPDPIIGYGGGVHCAGGAANGKRGGRSRLPPRGA